MLFRSVSDRQTGNSLRGARGYFTPIPDMPLKSVSASELAAYADRADFYRRHGMAMDPLVAAVKRYALNDDGLERIVIDANISPLVEENYGDYLSMLGPPTNVEIA